MILVILSVGGLGKAILNLKMQCSDKKSWFAIIDIKFSFFDSFVVKDPASMLPASCVCKVTFLDRSNKLSASCISLF